MSRRWQVALLALTVLAAGFFAPRPLDAQTGDETTGYRFGVFPFDPPALIRKRFAPVAQALAKAVERPVSLRTRSSFEKFAEELEKQRYDIVFLQPFDFVTAEERFGYLPLARRGEPIYGVLVASGEDRVAPDLAAETVKIATPPPIAAVTRLFWLTLAAQGLPANLRAFAFPYRNHSACLHAVAIGDADACVTAAIPLRQFERRNGVTMRELSRTLEIPSSLFAVHRRVPPPDRQRLRETILGWSKCAAGRSIQAALGQRGNFVAVEAGDYDIVRRLRALE